MVLYMERNKGGGYFKIFQMEGGPGPRKNSFNIGKQPPFMPPLNRGRFAKLWKGKSTALGKRKIFQIW